MARKKIALESLHSLCSAVMLGARIYILLTNCFLTEARAAAPALDPPPSPSSAPTPWSAQLFLKREPNPKRIQGLFFSDRVVPISLRPDGDKLRPLIAIHGHFKRPGWALYAGSLQLLKGEAKADAAPQAPEASASLAATSDQNDREFTLYLYLKGHLDSAVFSAIAPDGSTETEEVVLVSPDAQDFDLRSSWGELVFSIGYSELNYFQTQYGNFSSRTGLLELSYASPEWRYGLGVVSKIETTILTLSSSPPGLGPQLIQGKLDGSYLFRPMLKNRLQLKALLGISYLSLLSNGSPFGFANLLAIDAGASMTYTFSPRSSFIADFRYVPLSGVISFSQAGVDMDFGLSRVLENHHRVEIDLGYFDYAYKQDASTVIRAGAVSLRLGYSI